MPDLTAKRTLVKSPPELWSELSEVERLARHLGAFGEIKITKLEPEHTVAWEGEGASGTVSIEPSGWGTKVTLTAQLPEAEAAKTPSAGYEPRVEESIGNSAVAHVTPKESSVPETAAGEEAAGEAETTEVEESVVEEPEVEATEVEATKVAEPEVKEPEVAVPVVEEHGVEEPGVEVTKVAEPGVDATEVAESVVAEPEAEASAVAESAFPGEPPAPEPVEPVRGKPRRKRGLLAWLFRQRSSTQAATAPIPASSGAVLDAAAEQPPVAEETRVEVPIADQAGIAEEPVAKVESPVAEESLAAEEALTAEAESPVAEEESPAADEESLAAEEESPVAEEESLVAEEESPVAEEEPPAAEEGSPVAEESPAAEEESPVAEEAETPVADAETSSIAEEAVLPDFSRTEEAIAELTEAAASQDPRFDPERAQAILDGALDALGSAHHRPFSRG
jgi:hypothetical protein